MIVVVAGAGGTYLVISVVQARLNAASHHREGSVVGICAMIRGVGQHRRSAATLTKRVVLARAVVLVAIRSNCR